MTTTAQPDFNALSPEEQRAVAERLLKIKESGWKPFWCPEADCDGMPHWALDKAGDCIFVDHLEVSGPAGQPVGDRVYEDEDGGWVQIEDDQHPEPGWTLLGRPVLDPAWAHNHARVDQRLPPWRKPWVLMILSGRGAGKTRTGIEFVTLSARKGVNGAIVGRRGTELVNTHVAELIKHAHPEFTPVHWASKDLLEWPNGAKTYLFSAERPENIRSVNLSYFWFDEAAWMDEIKAAWANARFAARVKSPGNPIHFLITSTPTPTEWVMKMEDDPEVIVRRVSTYANRANLDAEALAEMEREYEGTRMGRQELHGEVLRDVEGALWTDELFRHLRVDEEGFQKLLDSMDDRVLSVDPAGSANKRSDATGIIGGGAQHFDDDGSQLALSRFYILGRATIKGSPSEWAEQVFKAARLLRVNRIVAEKNFGGEMVKQVLTDHAKLNPETSQDEDGNDFRIEVVHAAKSKETRAEPVVGKYEKGVVCVDGEALVSTGRGLIPLRDVEVGDLTLTRSGFRRVQATWDMGIQDTLEVTTSAGVSVAMTPDHRVFTCNRGWVHACELSPTDTLVVCDEENYDPVLTVGARQGAESRSPGVAPVRPSTSGLLANVSRSALTRLIGGFGTTYKGRGTTRRVGTKEGNSSTALCGSQSEVRYQRGGMYTTETTTPATTQWTTLNRNPQENTANTTTPEGGFNAGNTTPRKQSTGRMLRGLGRLILSTSSYARNAGLRSKAERLIRESDSARPPVTHDGGIVSVRAAGAKHVYDISVEGEHEFFANGVLVHNCHVTSPTVFGDLSELEKQQTTWVPKSRGGRMPSPNDIDALVWLISSLQSKVKFKASVATSKDAMARLKKTRGPHAPRNPTLRNFPVRKPKRL